MKQKAWNDEKRMDEEEKFSKNFAVFSKKK